MVARAGSDYYALLGVPRNADDRTIKKAFRTLARELHPDISRDPRAAELFHDVLEAYQMLSHPESRNRYDRFGRVPVAERPGQPGSGLFDDLFDARREPSRRGEDVLVEVTVGLYDATRGATPDLRYAVRVPCRTCRGAASLTTRRCGDCGGLGRVDDERTIAVAIPPGTRDGDRIEVPGEGHADRLGGGAGDLYVDVRVDQLPDAPHIRRLALAGAVCAAILFVLTLLVFH